MLGLITMVITMDEMITMMMGAASHDS